MQATNLKWRQRLERTRASVVEQRSDYPQQGAVVLKRKCQEGEISRGCAAIEVMETTGGDDEKRADHSMMMQYSARHRCSDVE